MIDFNKTQAPRSVRRSPIYIRFLENLKDIPERLEISQLCWDPTPWLINVYLGEANEVGQYAHEQEVRTWCEETLGKESAPIHQIFGRWRLGGFVFCGESWIGFDTEDTADCFKQAFPALTTGYSFK